MDFLKGFQDNTNKTETINGATARETTNSALLDFFALAGAMRTKEESDIISLFEKAFIENPLYALRCLCYLRDIRGGQGERRVFRICFKWLINNRKLTEKQAQTLIELTSFFGRWDDLFFDPSLAKLGLISHYIYDQLQLDIKNDKIDGKISLLAKWLPSENTSSEKTKILAKIFCNMFSMNSKTYRQTLSKLRKRIKLIEHNLSGKDYESINYETVPSQAMLKYRKAFKKHDSDKYEKYLEDVKNGKKEIKTGTLFPYQIVSKCLNETLTKTDITHLNITWENLQDYCKKEENSICVCDVSGSMEEKISNKVTCMDVAISLAIYIAERNKGIFNNNFITFSDRPTLERIKGNNIYEKCRFLKRAHWSCSTNIEKVFDLILKTALQNQLKQEDIPQKVYIVSDMEFNRATNHSDDILFDNIKQKFENSGYKIPKLVFWRVNVLSEQFPTSINEKYSQHVSGFNPSLMKYLIEDEFPSAYDNMMNILNSERYSINF